MARLIPLALLILLFSFHGPIQTALAGESIRSITDSPMEIVSENSDRSLRDAQSDQPEEISLTSPTVPECLVCLDYGELVLSDTLHVLSSPLRWEREEWLTFSLATVGVGAATLLDKPVFDAFQKHPHTTSNKIANIFEPFGAEYAIGILGLFYLDGLATQNPKATAVAQDGIAASLIGPGLITTGLKLAVGRSRPNENKGTHHLDPFSGDASFPPGHTTEAFTLASVLTEHYPLPWVEVTSYGMAGLVGYARIVHNAHFVSDVIAGALIGTTVGKSVVRFNQQSRIKFQISPLIGPELRGAAVAFPF